MIRTQSVEVDLLRFTEVFFERKNSLCRKMAVVADEVAHQAMQIIQRIIDGGCRQQHHLTAILPFEQLFESTCLLGLIVAQVMRFVDDYHGVIIYGAQ